MKILKQSASRNSTWVHCLVSFSSIFCIKRNQKFVLLNIHLGNSMQHILCLHWPLCYLPGLDSHKGREIQKKWQLHETSNSLHLIQGFWCHLDDLRIVSMQKNNKCIGTGNSFRNLWYFEYLYEDLFWVVIVTYFAVLWHILLPRCMRIYGVYVSLIFFTQFLLIMCCVTSFS